MFGFGQAGHEDDRDVRGLLVGLQPARDLEAVDAGHHRVEQDDVGHRLGGALQRALAVGCDQHRIARLVERIVQHREVVGHVVDDQHHVGVAVGRFRRRPPSIVGQWQQRRCRRQVAARRGRLGGALAGCRLIASSWKLRASARICAAKAAQRGRRLRSGRAGAGCRADSRSRSPPAAPAAARHPAARASERAAAGAGRCSTCGQRAIGSTIQSSCNARPSQSSSSALRTGLRMKSSAAMPASFSTPFSKALAETIATGASLRRSARSRRDRLPAVDAGHRQVHQDRVGAEFAQASQAFISGRRLPHLEAERRRACSPSGRDRPPRCRRPAAAAARRGSRCAEAGRQRLGTRRTHLGQEQPDPEHGPGAQPPLDRSSSADAGVL